MHIITQFTEKEAFTFRDAGREPTSTGSNRYTAQKFDDLELVETELQAEKFNDAQLTEKANSVAVKAADSSGSGQAST